jgi:hypothetical protein
MISGLKEMMMNDEVLEKLLAKKLRHPMIIEKLANSSDSENLDFTKQ